MIDLIALCSAHFISDIVLQSRTMGKEKSKDPMWMFAHFLLVFLTFFIAGLFVFRDMILPVEDAALLACGVALIHCMQDWFVWMLYRCHVKVRVVDRLTQHSGIHNHSISSAMKQWKCLKDYWFFFAIGIDQYLHYILLIGIWGMFIQGG